MSQKRRWGIRPHATGIQALVAVQRGSGYEDRPVTLGAANAHEVVVTGGLDEGVVIARNVQSRAAR